MDKKIDRRFKRFNDAVNMSVSELQRLNDTENYDVYEEQKSAGQPIDEPRQDVIRLLETPKNEWKNKDDGFNEFEEAGEVTGFVGRMSKVEQGDPMPGTDPPVSKRDMSLLNWGFDPDPDDGFP